MTTLPGILARARSDALNPSPGLFFPFSSLTEDTSENTQTYNMKHSHTFVFTSEPCNVIPFHIYSVQQINDRSTTKFTG